MSLARTARNRAANQELPGANLPHTCPLHPDVRRTGPGICQQCTMVLQPVQPLIARSEPELPPLIRRFGVALFLTALVVAIALSDTPTPAWQTGGVLSSATLTTLQLLLTTMVVFGSGRPLLTRGYESLARRRPDRFTLIALGAVVAFLYSLAATVLPGVVASELNSGGVRTRLYFESAAVIIALGLFVQIVELQARKRSRRPLESLLHLQPAAAVCVRDDGSEAQIPLHEVRAGDRLRVGPAASVPADGRIVDGQGSVDESMLTGESARVPKSVGDPVTCGTRNGDSSFVMQAERVGTDTLLADTVRRVEVAQRSKAAIQRVADRLSRWLVPAVLAAAAVTLGVWLALGPAPAFTYALVGMISVLVVACPHALGVATPISVAVGIGRGACSGVLIKNAEVLERLAKVDTVIVDKTGTLTEGRPELTSIVVGSEGIRLVDEIELLQIVASLEAKSEHPLAEAIVTAARGRELSLIEPAWFESRAGMGVKGSVSGVQVAAGTAAWMAEIGVATASLEDTTEILRREGQTTVFVALDRTLVGVVGVTDPVKSTSFAAVRRLRDAGVHVMMLTGDSWSTAAAVARMVGVERFEAEVLPENRHEVVDRLQGEWRVVALAGHGSNDAPAVAQADVGIAIDCAADDVLPSAGVVLPRGDLSTIARARALSRGTLRNVRQNLYFALACNLICIPIAAGALYPAFGILPGPILAAAATSLISFSVVVHALRLQTAEPEGHSR